MIELLKPLVAADAMPTLSQSELDAIATRSGGDLNYAAMLGWEMKAAKSATMIDFSADGATFNRAQFMEHALKMQDMFSNKIAGTIRITKE